MDRKCGSAKMPRFLASGWKEKDAQTCRHTRTRPHISVIASIRIYASRWRIERLPHRLEPEDNPGREPKVILRSAGELGGQVVRLNQAPMNPVEHLRIDAASEC